MANEDKFSKTIDDEQLDEVAGGTTQEMQKDIKFLNAIGAKLDKNASSEDVQDVWETMGVDAKVRDHKKVSNLYYKRDEDDTSEYLGLDQQELTRQDAMIEAMRKTGKFVDLDQYL